MKTSRYWTRAEGEFAGPDEQTVTIRARGWSDVSLEAARAKAMEIAGRVAERISSSFAKADRYPYGDRPLPEAVIREFNGAIVTRNKYGALVLNTDQMMFVDIDRKAEPPKSPGIFASLFGKPKPAPAPAEDPVIEELGAITRRHNLGARLYETAAGYRLIITSARFKPGSVEADALLNEYKSDPLYIRLCRMQETFRARLTPKPWRCGYPKRYLEFPFETSREQEFASRWETEYNAKATGFATCLFVGEVGSAPAADDFKELIAYHDQETKAFETRPPA